MSVQAKTYVSRGVQTGENIPSLPSSLGETLPLAASLNLAQKDESGGVLQVNLDSSDNIQNQLRGTLAYESAYIQSKTSENSEFLPLLASKNKKYTGFGLIGRGNPIGSQQRIVSLPNPPPTQNESVADRNSRVVSMPECLIPNSSPFYLGNSFSPDDGQSHNQPLSSPRRRQWQDGYERDYFYDAPQTPSPPSSPESVVIIANKPNVPGSFLRRTNSDDDGWVAWASSPPRPIPALHGPLSLPYARCPSGAEGTVTEGDDLSHKIWGLAVGDPHIPSTTARIGKNDMHQNSQVASSGDEFCVQPANSFNDPNLDFQHSMSLHRPSANVIDLSRPSTFYNSIGFEGIGRHLIVDCFGENALPRLSASSGSTPTEMRGISPSDGLNIRHPSTMPYSGNKTWTANTVDIVNDPPSNAPTEDANWKPLRVGATDAKVDKATRIFATNGQNRLNKSAPVFVPGPDWQAKDLYIQYARDGTRSDTRLPPSRRREYFQPSHNDTMSPPTSSPSWSPMFSHFVDIQTLTTPRHSQDNPMFPDPKIYSPAFDDEDYSTKLMTMVQQFKGQEHSKVAKRYPTRTTKPTGESVGEWKSSNEAGNTERNLVIDENQSAHINLDSRPNLSQQHPRSIPLARLIQRRLSSVVEEVGAETLVSQLEANFTERSYSHESLDVTGLHREIIPSAMNSRVYGGMQPPETMEDRQHHGEPNAIVRLPRKTALHRSAQSSSGTVDSKRTNRYEGRAERKNITNLGGNGASAAVTTKDGKLMAKMIEGIKEESV